MLSSGTRGIPAGLLVVLAAAILAAPAGVALRPTAAAAPAGEPGLSPAPAAGAVLYLPLVAGGNQIWEDSPIWVDASTPDRPQVVLFRHRFAIDHPVDDAQLAILADTRYEVWLNGAWLGRGPARFSLSRREYDLYSLGRLRAGYYLVAVLVQWAPNERRSESLTPMLLGHVRGRGDAGLEVETRTGPAWRAVPSSAWQDDAAAVHAWNLIGPTELLDLRQHPSDWTSPDFDDAAWPPVVTKAWSLAFPSGGSATGLATHEGASPQAETTSLSAAIYRPRSIPFLEEVSIPVQLIESGQLSPGRAMVELVPPLAEPLDLPFTALSPTTLTLEMLADAGQSLPAQVQLDGAGLAWTEAGQDRPDVQIATALLIPGPHSLSFPATSPDGLTFSLSMQDLDLEAMPFEQGLHAGRRLLLAEPVPQAGLVITSAAPAPEASLATIEFLEPASYAILDLGRVIHGRLVAQVTGPAGSLLDVGWAQRLWQNSRPLPYPGSLHPEWNQVDSWVLDGGSRTVSTIDARSGRYLLLAAWGGAPLRLDNIQVLEERYPLLPRGAFSSSDPVLDRIWQVGVETLYPNMTDAYTDTPWRERGQWWGDAFVQDQINEIAFGDTGLLRRGLTLMADAFQAGRPKAMAPHGGGNYMLDYGMLWVQGLEEYAQRTGDDQLVRDLYPALQDLMAYLEGQENAATGLLDLPYGHWSVTALIDWAGSDSRYGQSTALNAFYYATLSDAAALADRVEDPARATAWRQRAQQVRAQANALLFLPGQQRYVTTIYEGQSLPPTPHAQAWPLAYGLVPEAQVEGVSASLLDLLSPDPAVPNLDSYGMYWLLRALGEAGRVPEALQIIKSYYGRMLDLGATSWWERFRSDLDYYSSLCHGWSGAPTWFLSTYVLGARQPEAGKWVVRPAFGALDQAWGTLPLHDGDLQLAWTSPSCEEATLTLAAPPGASGEIVVLFAGATTTLTLNDVTIWSQGVPLMGGVWEGQDGIHVAVDAGGSYTLQAVRVCDALSLSAIGRRPQGETRRYTGAKPTSRLPF